MSSGALIQLQAVGPQDGFLTIDAEFSFWRGGYRRHTAHAMTEIEQPMQVSGALGRQNQAKLERAGDLVAQMYLYSRFAPIEYQGDCYSPGVSYAHYTNGLAHAMIEHIQVDIGSQMFDQQNGTFLDVWHSLTHSNEKNLGGMVGYADTRQTLVDWARDVQDFYMPFQFWFNRAYEQALPLIALQYHEVRFQIRTRPIHDLVIYENECNECNTHVSRDPLQFLLLVNYVFLETAERRMFAQNPHEYLIEQTQMASPECHNLNCTTQSPRLIFNHPVKELMWVMRRQENTDANRWFDYSGPINEKNGLRLDPFESMEIQFNNLQRTINHLAKYYREVQPYQHHTNKERASHNFVYCYCFALYPEDWRPSGSANMSRIDNVNLRWHFSSQASSQWVGDILVFARNYNLMKVLSGMAGLTYSS